MSTPPDPQSALLDLYTELLAYNRRIANELGLRLTDLSVLDVVVRCGQVSPTKLAQLTHMHPATMTGVLRRLETAGWIDREHPEGDRRAVLIGVRADRVSQIAGRFVDLARALDRLHASRRDDLEAVETYLHEVARVLRGVQDAGGHAPVGHRGRAGSVASRGTITG